MSTQPIDDGGPAFGRPVSFRPSDGMAFDNGAEGMSLRDYFAAAALPWCLAEFAGNAEDQPQAEHAAYQIADAMLAERKRKEPTDA